MEAAQKTRQAQTLAESVTQENSDLDIVVKSESPLFKN